MSRPDSRQKARTIATNSETLMSPLAGIATMAVIILAAGTAAADDVVATARTLCGSRDPCQVAATTAAGTDAEGHALTVVELALPTPERNAPNASPGENSDWQPECQPYGREFWLLQDGPGAYPPRLLFTLCNDGYGAAGVGEDEVTVSANRLVHTQSGGSNWRWSRTRTAQLSPLQVLGEEWDGWWTGSPINIEAGRWDWTRFAGRVEWSAPACGPDGEPPSVDEDEEHFPGHVHPGFAYSPIPEMAASSLPEGAGDAELGNCALQIDARGDAGFVIHGDAAAAPAGEWMRVLMTDEPRTLIVSVRTDGSWRGGAANWIYDDHLELWLGPTANYYSHCLDPEDRPRQWGIRITDGAVFDGYGSPADRPRVEARRERADAGPDGPGSIVTFRLALPEGDDSDNITVVLSRGDGAHRQERLVATSRVRAGDAATLGRTFVVAPEAARCAVHDGRLDLTETGSPAMLSHEPGG